MKLMLALTAGILAIIVALALMLPCEACRLRRERMQKAYEAWRAAHSGK